MAAMTGRPVRVVSTSAAIHPGDEPIVVQPALTAVPPRAHIGVVGPLRSDGRQTVEVVVDGWRFEFEVEDAARADLRERASRDRIATGGGSGPLEIRAIIAGRIVSVAVTVGDAVEAGQTLLAVEAMKMQNELRAPRGGTVSRVLASAGATVDAGEILVVLG